MQTRGGNKCKLEEGTNETSRKNIRKSERGKAEKLRFEEKKRTTFAVRSYSLFSYSPK